LALPIGRTGIGSLRPVIVPGKPGIAPHAPSGLTGAYQIAAE
jgi:hypothetical protein